MRLQDVITDCVREHLICGYEQAVSFLSKFSKWSGRLLACAWIT
jgi:hypothetical protein